LRVLIADDNVDLAESIAAVLRSRGSDARVCDDGGAAVTAAEAWLPDVLLVDLKLPVRSGLEVIEALRGKPIGRIIAMTGYDSPSNIRAAERLGAEAVLRKPFSMPDLIRSLGLEDRSLLGESVTDCRIAVLCDDPATLSRLATSCQSDHFGDGDELRSAVGDIEYDAVMLLQPESVEELTTDIALLDPDVAVVPTTNSALLESAVRQTRLRREAGRELELFRTVARDAPGALLIVERDPPQLRFWNQAFQKLVGYRDDELEGGGLRRIEEDLGNGALHALVREARASGQQAQATVPVRVRGGSSRPLEVRAVLADALGRPDAPVAMTLAPTKAERGDQEALQLLGMTAAGVAHEMRNTLAGVGNSLSVLRSRMRDDAAATEVVQRVLERVARAAEVMNDLLDFARPVTPRLMAAPASLVLSAAREQIADSAPEGVEVRTVLPDPTLRILVDPVRLQMALVNLGNNAVQAIGEGPGTITMTCSRAGDSVLVCVEDDGPGVPQPLRAKLFDPFFTTRARGSGLGLANVRKLVEAHGGTIRLLDSAAGARFAIRLPRRPVLPGAST